MRAAQSNCGPRLAAQGRRSSGGWRVGAVERARVVLFAVRVRPPTVHRASGGGSSRACARKLLAGGSGFGVILHLLLRAALGKGGSRSLFIAGSRFSPVTPAPLLPLCLAQRRYFFALDDAHWMNDAPPRRRPPRRRPAPLDEPWFVLRRALNGGLHAVLGAATTTARAELLPPPVVTTRRAPPPRKTLFAEHVASTAELNDLLGAFAADRAFTSAVAHATTGGQMPRRLHSRACAVARLIDRCGLYCCCASLTVPAAPGVLNACADRNAAWRRTCAAIAVLDGATPRPVAPHAPTL